ncbi:MAG: hypothetical protein JW941_03905 [Candidatus Coatesbacteria bacterium]|nr:hypothetical protein [Candidatus Coatesbacteria bacterium]
MRQRSGCSALGPLALLVAFLCLTGCAHLAVKNIYYDPSPGDLSIDNPPSMPLAFVDEFIDDRAGEDHYSGLFRLWLVPYSSYEYPQFYRDEPKEGVCPEDPDCPTWPKLREQYRTMVRRHLAERGLFKFIEQDYRFDQSDALFRIAGTINKTSAIGHYSLFGLGVIPGELIFAGPYADGRYVLDVTLECKDIAGETIAVQRISGTTSKWIFCEETPPPFEERYPRYESYARLQPLAEFLKPEIETFAVMIHDALSRKNTEYWERLEQARICLSAGRLFYSRTALIWIEQNDISEAVADLMSDEIECSLSSDAGLAVVHYIEQEQGEGPLGIECDSPDCWAELGTSLNVPYLVLASAERRDGEFVLVLKLIDVSALRPVNIVTKSCTIEAELPRTAKIATRELMDR